MTIEQAISNLKIHQQWRLGADIVMIEPKELTESIDIILSQFPQQEISDEDIEKAAANLANPNVDKTDNWIEGSKWYREQLKQRQ